MAYGLQLFNANGKNILDTNVDRIFRIEDQFGATNFNLYNHSNLKNTEAWGDATLVTLDATWNLPDIPYDGIAFCPTIAVTKSTPCNATSFTVKGLIFVFKGADKTIDDCYNLIKRYFYILRY